MLKVGRHALKATEVAVLHTGVCTVAKILSSGTTISVKDNSGFKAPYTLPMAGQVVAISVSGGNTAASVTPTTEGWGSDAYMYSLFNSYGGGVFVPKYSVAGAWVMAGSGGHNHADDHGAGVFDFATGKWLRLDNANGVKRVFDHPHAYTLSQTTGSPFYEIIGSQVPSPPHAYNHATFLDQGAKGSIIHITRAAIARESVGSGSVHVFDLTTRLWSRFTNNLSPRVNVESDVVRDVARNRYWLVMNDQHSYRNVMYFDLSDKTFKTTADQPEWASGELAGYNRTWLHQGMLIRQTEAGTLWYFDPDNAVAGWNRCVVSDPLPSSNNSFVRYGSKSYYWYSGTGGNTLVKMIPPTNPKTGTWDISSVSFTGDTLPVRSGGPGGAHYKNLIYVPAIDCLAWVPGGSNPVYLIKPNE